MINKLSADALYIPAHGDLVAAGIYRRQLCDGTGSLLTRMADSERILIYRAGLALREVFTAYWLAGSTSGVSLA